MKKMILCAVAMLGLSACALPVELKENQRDERQALREFHQAERQAFRAEEVRKAATGAAVAATAAKVLADAQAEAKLKALEIEMSK
ncbi:MAG: hypothetical protein ACRCUF_21245 [Aeromonas sobria]